MESFLLMVIIANADHSTRRIVDSRWESKQACLAHADEAFVRYQKARLWTSKTWMVMCVEEKYWQRPHR
jgi:hypothetical protein